MAFAKKGPRDWQKQKELRANYIRSIQEVLRWIDAAEIVTRPGPEPLYCRAIDARNATQLPLRLHLYPPYGNESVVTQMVGNSVFFWFMAIIQMAWTDNLKLTTRLGLRITRINCNRMHYSNATAELCIDGSQNLMSSVAVWCGKGWR